MEITLEIDDELLQELRDEARRKGISLNEMIHHILSEVLIYRRREEQIEPGTGRPYREKTFDLGQPKIDITKALSVADELEDEEIIKRLRMKQ